MDFDEQEKMIVCLGEILVDFVSSESGCTLADAPGFLKAAGGAPANVAAGIAKLGGSSAFLGKVGADPFGDYLIETLRTCGVETRGIVRDETARTTLAFVSLTKSGERDFLFYRHPGADQLYSILDIEERLAGCASIFHFGTVSMTAEPARTATLHAAKLAKSHGSLISFDPNLRLNLWPDDECARSAIHEGAMLADIIKVSEEELEWLPKTAPPKLLLVTKGSAGCKWYTPGHSGEVPGFPVETVDTTGAGDAFHAAVLTKIEANPAILTNPDALTAMCRFANAAGALATTGKGAIPSLPYRRDVERFLDISLPNCTP